MWKDRYFGFRSLIGAILCYLILCGFVRIGITYQEMKHYENLQVLNLEQPVKNGSAERAQVQKYHDYTLFAEKRNMEIENKEFSRKTKVTCVSFCGDSVNLFPMSYPLTTEDETGCLISRKTAWELFGDTNVIGKKLTYQKKTYEVRGILLGDQSLFCYAAGKGEEMEFPLLAMRQADKESRLEKKSELQTKYGMLGTWSPLYWSIIPENVSYEQWKQNTEFLQFKENNCIEILYLKKLEYMKNWGKIIFLSFLFLLILKKRLTKRWSLFVSML